ncbi:MAG: M14 family metallocarboxypeptidase [Phycisphaerales bacterium]|nr:hypothetical protein [Planctomycetota bacterium]MCH8507774.1 M14 family metallocarboxypeptidase [Phycisphaerales bacterium]
MITTLLAVLATAVVTAHAVAPDAPPALVQLDIRTAADLARLAAVEGELLVCEVRPGRHEALIPPDAVPVLQAAGLNPAVIHPDAHAAAAAERRRALDTLARGEPDWWADYKPLDAVIDKMHEMQARRPDLVEIFEIGRSWEDRPILAMRITGPRAEADPCRPAVLLHSLIHAREWITVMVNMWVAETLIAGFDDDPYITDLVNRVEWLFVPVVNPDGYDYTWTDDRFWRKNRRPPDPIFDRMGVDLNRNFGYQWGPGQGQSNYPGSPTYRGPAAFSEPETAALRDLTLATPQLRAHNDMHSFSEMILFPWGYTPALSPDHETFDALGQEMRQRIFEYRGRNYAVGPVFTTIYAVRGGTVDYFYGDRGIWSFSYELFGTNFSPPPHQIRPNAEETLPATLLLGEFVADRYGFIADINRDCAHDFYDVAAYLNLFIAGDPAADLTGSGTVNFLDFTRFIELFNQRR